MYRIRIMDSYSDYLIVLSSIHGGQDLSRKGAEAPREESRLVYRNLIVRTQLKSVLSTALAQICSHP